MLLLLSLIFSFLKILKVILFVSIDPFTLFAVFFFLTRDKHNNVILGSFNLFVRQSGYFTAVYFHPEIYGFNQKFLNFIHLKLYTAGKHELVTLAKNKHLCDRDDQLFFFVIFVLYTYIVSISM